MARTLSDLLQEIASRASLYEEPVLAHLCRMAALEADRASVPLQGIAHNVIGFWDWDVANDLDHLDPNCAALFGVAPALARKGLPISVYLKAVHPRDILLLNRAIGGALKSGGAFEAEYRIVTDDRVRWVFAKGYCTLDKSNRPERFPGVVMELQNKLN
jgi:PAS domain-containing protein